MIIYRHINKQNTERRFDQRCKEFERVINKAISSSSDTNHNIKYKSKYVIKTEIKEKMKAEILNSIDNWQGQKKSFLNEDDCFKKSKSIFHIHTFMCIHHHIIFRINI